MNAEGDVQRTTSRREFLKKSAYATGGAMLSLAALNQISPLIWKPRVPLEPNDSFWARYRLPPSPPVTSDLDVDVAVVGGGFTGLSSACFIRRASPHKRVALLEARHCGSGASGRNGAMVLTMTADRYMNFSADPQMDKRIYELTVQNIAFLVALGQQTGVDCEWQMRGALQVLGTAEDRKAAKDYVRQARQIGIPVEYWESPQIERAIGTAAYQAAFFDPNCGQVHPMKLVSAWKAAAEAADVAIYENTVVQHVQEGRTHVLSTSGGHQVRARALVLAANAFTPGLGFMKNAIVPVQEYVAITAPLSAEELALTGWRQPMAFNDSRTEGFYLGLTPDRRIHIGGGAPGYAFNNARADASSDPSHQAQLHQELSRLYPALSAVAFEGSWHGVVDWSLDASPSVGTTGRYNNVYYGIGYSGHGVNLTSLFGRIIADLEAGNSDPWTQYPFVNNRLYYVPNEPFRWLAAKAAMAWNELAGS